MRLFRRILLRRFVAAVLTAMLGVFLAEQAIADVHDGDHSETSTAAGAVSSSSAPERAMHTALVALPTGGDQIAAHVVAAGHAPALPDMPGTPGGPVGSHSMHVCHDAHGHVLTPPELPELLPTDRRHEDAPRSYVGALVSREHEPQLRPPIA